MAHTETKLHLSLVSSAMALGLVAGAASPSVAATVQTQSRQGDYLDTQYGGRYWSTFSSLLNAEHEMRVTADFSSVESDVDALFVNHEENTGGLTAAEIAAITGFVSTGHRAVIFGENNASDGWDAWNDSIMNVVGGAYSYTGGWSGCPRTYGYASAATELTEGVSRVYANCYSELDATVGDPVILFDNNFAALYSVGAGEVLVILDSNFASDSYLWRDDTEEFLENIVTWLGGGAEAPVTTPVPLPASLPILLGGLGALGIAARRKTA